MKIFPNEAFGFLRITVERPLRLRWEVTDETLAVVLAAKPIQKLEPEMQDALARQLVKHTGRLVRDRARAGRGARRRPGRSRTETARAEGGLGRRSPSATRRHRSVTEPQGRTRNPTPTFATTRTCRCPPMPVDVREPTRPSASPHAEYRDGGRRLRARPRCCPYVPDAWVDHDKTKIGYEIPLTRHFYKYVPPRPLAEIDAEIKALEEEIQALLGAVTE